MSTAVASRLECAILLSQQLRILLKSTGCDSVQTVIQFCQFAVLPSKIAVITTDCGCLLVCTLNINHLQQRLLYPLHSCPSLLVSLTKAVPLAFLIDQRQNLQLLLAPNFSRICRLQEGTAAYYPEIELFLADRSGPCYLPTESSSGSNVGVL